jgi:1-aminocyclopropane-1-carboxylate deaminase/D-cysteine desulfhydrase-like pyridoxal-dependent ACC family enzyme
MPDDSHGNSSLPLFEAYPRLATAVPWISLGHWPTPVIEARVFAKANGMQRLHIKREDWSHPHGAGNKVRGLEFLLADAERLGAKTIVTASSVGSHHICKTAWHARQLGIDTVAVVVPQPKADYVARNLLLGASVGTRYVPANFITALPTVIYELLRPRNRLREHGPYWIAPGGTTPLSCLGHVNAAFELKRQIREGRLPEPDYLYVAMGSLGTAAGLALGCALAGLQTQIVGVAVSYCWYATKGRWARFAHRTLALMRQHDPLVPDVKLDHSRMHVVGTALGDGYAIITSEGKRLSKEMLDLEGIELDGTYTSKTLHGAMQFIDANGLQGKSHLLWHTYHHIGPRDDLATFANRLPPTLLRYVSE